MTFYIAAFVFVLDRLTKIIVVNNIFLGQSIKIIPNIFYLTLILNNGAAFGLLKNNNPLFVSVSVFVIAFIVAYVWSHGKKYGTLPLALGLILGGALGNLFDRVRFGHVIDFLDCRIWPVFNIADSSITIGIIILVYNMLTRKKTLR